MVPRQKAIEKMFQIIKDEINSGKPLLAIGLTKFPDWGVIAGYEGKKIFCRTYYDENNEYSISKEFPWIMFRMKKKEGKKPSAEENIINSIRLAVDMANTPKIDNYANGLVAYDVWIKDLENEENFRKMDRKELFIHWHINGWIYDSLYDARNAAAKYLKNASKELKGKNKEIVKEAAEIFEKIRGLVLGIPYRYSEKMKEKLYISIKNLLGGYDFPILANVNFGHTDPIITIPYGALARISSKRNEFVLSLIHI